MQCPRCGANAAPEPECPRCGIILAKARPRPTRPRPSGPAPPGAGRALLLPLAGLAAVVAGAVVHLRVNAPPPSGPPAVARPSVAAAVEPPVVVPEDAPAPPRVPEPGAPEVHGAEPLPVGRVSREDLGAELLRAADAHRAARRFDEAIRALAQAATLAPDSPRPPKAALAVHLDAGDWNSAEEAGRRALALAPADGEAARGLAYALVRQDRTDEAVELLRAFVGLHPDPEARGLLERLRRGQGTEGGLDEARLAHFHVRYDGDAHEDVGREILRVLDRHYATLVRAFDHRPAAPVPVILLSRERYDDATGAPFWSGGQYDSFDGRVRVPIGGLTSSLTPDLDGTLLHELTHAFVAEMSGGVAPREIHEGLAQRMEGRRTDEVAPQTLRALADGRLRGVGAFYLSALSLVEDLAAQRGQGGLNDLLRAMAETGDVDAAFVRVYGSDLAAVRAAWAARLRQRHGS